MADTKWLVIKRKTIIWALVGLVLLFTLYRATDSYRSRIMSLPAEKFQSVLNNTLNSESFRFSVKVKMADRLISDIEGKKAGPDKIHITGTMQNMPVELINTEGKSYIKGYWSKNWAVLQNDRLVDSELFITELNPMVSFVFKDIPQIKTLNTEKVEGEELLVLEMRPIVENPLMKLNYHDFMYRIWVEPQKELVRKAHITANGKNGDRDRLEIVIELWDYNKQIKISPPDKLN